MRILVIGGTAFIGPQVVERLSNLGHEITVFHRGEHETRLPYGIRHVHDPRAARPVTEFPKELTALAWDVVVAMHAMGERDAEALGRAFRGIARRVVAVSSADVYRAYGVLLGSDSGDLEPLPLTEEAPLRQGLFPYRSSASGPEDFRYDYEKILVERVLLSDAALPGTVLRLPAVYGPGDEQRRLFPCWKRMADGRPAILLGERQAAWRWTHGYIENVAHAITLAVTLERAKGRIYNVGEAETPATIERVRLLAQAVGWKGEVVTLPDQRLPKHLQMKANFAQDMVLDTNRIRENLDYAEPVPAEEALRRTLSWEREHPPESIDSAMFDYTAEDEVLSGRARRH